MDKEKKILLTAKCIRFLLVAAVAFLSIMAVLKADRLGGMEVFFFLLSAVPISLLTNLYGLITGMVCFSLIFLCCAFASPEQAYFASYYLLAVLQANFLLAGGRRKGWLRTLLMILFSALFMGAFFYLVYYGIGGRSMLTFNAFYLLMCVALLLPVMLIMGLLAKLLPRITPPGLKSFFSCLSARRKSELKEGDLRYMRSARSISGQLTFVLAGEALLLALGGATFANILMPGLGEAIIQRHDEALLSPGQEVRPEAETGLGEASGASPEEPAAESARSGAYAREAFSGEDAPPEGAPPEGTPPAAPGASGEPGLRGVPNMEQAPPPAEQAPPPAEPGMRPSILENVVEYLDTVDIVAREDLESHFVLNNDGLAFDLKLILLLFSTAFPLVTLANYYIQMRIARPIVLLANKANDFAMGNEEERASTVRELDEIPMKKRHDEISILHRSIRSTFHEINDYVEQLKEEQRLKEDLEVARRSSEAKSSFLSNMSHEIRTPINAVLGLDEMILRESKEPQTLSYATDIKNSGKSLLSLVNDILDFSKIEAGKLEILPVEYELSSTINDLVNMIRIKAEEKGLELKIEVDPELPHLLYGDEIRLKQCALNILTNAVKYTEKGCVTMCVGFKKLSEEEISLRYQVLDTGIGIKEEDLAKLYSPFERIEEVRNRTIEGTGLGMSIVKNLLAMMGTTLKVKSVYGEGSDFSFEVTQRVVKWEPIGNFAETYRRTAGKAGVSREKLRAPEALILITDDTPMNLTVAKGLLKRTEIQVDTATSGAETLEKIAERHYDVIFIDHRMPKMDGIETLHAMGTVSGNLNTDTPCIALTANAVSGAREMYIGAGFSDYLSKPIDGEKLEDMLIRYLPEEKVQLSDQESGQEPAVSGEESPGKAAEEAGSGYPLPQTEWYPGLDHELGLANCMTEEILEAAIGDFRDGLSEKPELIRRLLEEGNIRDYVTEVHALKSSARLIGASELSRLAEELELAGDAGREDVLKEKTPELLSLYISYREKLSPAGENPKTDEQQVESLPELPPEQLEEAWIGIREFADAFDFDSALGILDMLKEYSLPDKEESLGEALRKALRAGDREEALKLLER